jgi:hypothetical protein
MAEPLLSWEKLKPHNRDQYRSFEEFCYQIATGLYGQLGRFTSIDDSGGGDGVEFYLTFPNGEQWGWQAKFYYPDNKLTASRKEKIKQSLKRSCEVHPRLTKWFLCTPKNLTSDAQKWFDEELPSAKIEGHRVVPRGRKVELDNWGESDYIAWMREERFAGCRLYFFGELELSLEWFRLIFEKQLEGVRDKFDRALHTETYTDQCVHQALGDAQFVSQLGERLTELSSSLDEVAERVNELKKQASRVRKPGHTESESIGAAYTLQATLFGMLKQMEHVRDMLAERRLDEVRDFNWNPVLLEMQDALSTYEKLSASGATDVSDEGVVKDSNEPEELSRQEHEEQITYLSNYLGAVAGTAASFMDEARAFARQLLALKQHDLHVFGSAGYGKTHLSCHICEARLNSGLPAVLILGRHFTGDRPLEEQLRAILDIPPAYSWNQFLRALAAAAKAYRTRIPVIIDGLNEATHAGLFSNVWRLGLPGLGKEFATVEDVVLVTTCRDSYKEAIWPDGGPENLLYAHGFEENVGDAVSRYFDAYKIKADLTAAPLEQFSHPIYLKIFCETVNQPRQEERYTYVGEQTLFKTFDEYLKLCDRIICDRFGLRRGGRLVSNAIDKIAEYLWEHRTRFILIDSAANLIDGEGIDTLDWERSRTHALESEGLLVCRDREEGEEKFFFTYDLLGGYVIARQLLTKHSTDLVGFLNAEKTISALYCDNYSTLHPLYEDIRRCVAALLPVQTGQYLHDLSNNPIAFATSVNALFELAPEYVNNSCVQLVKELFEKEDNRVPLFERSFFTAGHITHPLNAQFWHGLLKELSLPERDVSWTEYVRRRRREFEGLLDQFEENCQKVGELSGTNADRMHLLARRFMWVLTSTVRPLRDKATRAMYWYGRRFPKEFFDLMLESLGVNDPYVPERMLAAIYGVVMALQFDPEHEGFVRDHLPQWGRGLYDAMFTPGAPFSTTHVLTRDYARRTIRVALNHHHGLLNSREEKRITPPFKAGGIRKWGESEDRDKGKYKDGDAPIQMDFDNYTIGSLVDDRSNYDSKHKGYRKVRANIYWRIYDLGYSLERFSRIDREIQRYNWNKNYDPTKTDRYGKKYSWIAYFELTGYLRDKGLPKKRDEDERIYNAEIDPSFPVDIPDYRLIQEDFLGDRSVSTREWIRKGGVPEVKPYLIVSELMGEQGPWIMLDGHVDQENEAHDRNRFTFIRSFLVKTTEADEFVERLKHQDLSNRWLPEIPESHYTYAGEIPWSDMFPNNEWVEFEFVIKEETVRVPKVEPVFLQDGKPLPDDEVLTFLQEIAPLLEGDDEGPFNAALRRRNIEIVETTVEREEIKKETKSFRALIPVRDQSWEGYETVVAGGARAHVLARQLSDALGLKPRPQTFDLFDEDGKRASILVEHGKALKGHLRFTFIRGDLLDKYLNKEALQIVWAVWGERRHSVASMSSLAPAYSGKGEKPWRVFQQIITHEELIRWARPRRRAGKKRAAPVKRGGRKSAA